MLGVGAPALVGGIAADLTDELEQVAGHWWFLAVVFALALLDSVVPIVPSETAVIIGGVAAGAGDQHLGAVIAAAASGAFLGDNVAYLIGLRASGRLERRAVRSARFAAHLHWATRQIEGRGGRLLVTARFVPGGRTVLTMSSGATRQPRRWFVRWTIVAALVWATYAGLLGYLGGAAFEDDHTKAFLLAFGAAIGTTLALEAGTAIRRRRRAAPGPSALPERTPDRP